MKYDSLIFDLDGTLWDSSGPVAQAWNNVLSKLRINRKPIKVNEIEQIMGMPKAKIFETLFPEYPAEERERIAEGCLNEEIALLRREGAALYSGVKEGLQTLSKRYPLFIVSNCHLPYLETFFEWTKMRGLFKDCECHGNTGKPKGYNIALLKARNQLASPVYIGDTAGDQEAALSAGVPYFHVSYGFGTPAAACVEFSSFSDVVNHFL